MKNVILSLGKGLIVLLVVLILYNIFMSSSCSVPKGEEVKFSQFVEQTKSGKVRSVTITENKITGYTVSGKEFVTYAPNQYEGLANELINRGIVVEAKSSTPNPFMAFLFNWGPMILLLGFWIFFMRRFTGGGKDGALSFGKSKAKLSNPSSDRNSGKEKITFRNVAGQDEAKGELQEIVEFLKEPAKFQKLGGRIPRGVILIGPPGTGKTLLARAVAGEANVPFFSISGSDFVEMFVGVGASRVRDLFEQGKKNAPCIIFVDEIDAVGRHRGAGFGGGHDEREQTLNQLLAEMDGFDTNEGVILLAATNRPDVLDPALLRPGRFDRRVVVNRPDLKGRTEILEVHTKKIPLDKDVNLVSIARGTTGSVGADLANLVNEAAINAARHDQKNVKMSDFEFARDKATMGPEKRSLMIGKKDKWITAVHEAGHALLAICSRYADPLHKVTVVPRGMAMGLTQQLPLDDKYTYSKEYLIDQLRILMGGRCAEEIMLKQITTGASNDIERATDLARRMICEWGMSETAGTVYYKGDTESPFLGKDIIMTDRNYSEETKREIDQEIKKFIDSATKFAEDIITKNKNRLRKIALALFNNETLTGDDIRIIIANES